MLLALGSPLCISSAWSASFVVLLLFNSGRVRTEDREHSYCCGGGRHFNPLIWL